jgi:hypothetical protein
MEFTTIRVSEAVADELAERKGRGDSYDDVIREFLGIDETDKQPRAWESDETTGEPPSPTHIPEETEEEDVDGRRDETGAGDPEIDGRVWAVVDDVSEGWEEDHRLENRRRAAATVLQYAVDTGEAIGKSSEVVDEVREQYPVEGQSRETYWKRNIREVFTEVADYSKASRGYTVSAEDLETDDETGPYDPTDEF